GSGTMIGTIADTWRQAKGDDFNALVTVENVTEKAIGQYIVVRHPDLSTIGYKITGVHHEDGKSIIDLDDNDPGFEINADGTSRQMYYPGKQWTGEHTFRIVGVD